VFDSSADMRYLVLPRRPDGTEDLSEDDLAQLVTRDSMIGVTTAREPSGTAVMAS
jgi:nitrile hydratase